MSITRKLLKGMGLSDEQQETIIEAHTSTISEIRDERDRYKADADKLPEIQKQLDDTKAALEAVQNGKSDYETLKADYTTLQAEYQAFRDSVEKERLEATAREKFTELLKDMKISDAGISKILKWQGVRDVELDETGKIKEPAKLRKSIKEDWPEYIPVYSEEGTLTPTPPTSIGGTRMTLEQIDAIEDTAARQKAMLENHELFGF